MPGTITTERRYAGWGARLGAILIDGLIVVAVTFGLNIVAPNPATAGASLASVVFFLFPIAYCTWGNGRASGQTIGKRALGIRCCRDADGAALGYVRLLPLFDQKKQTTHDKVVGSVVLRA